VLSGKIQVPRVPQPESWQHHIYSRPGGHHWIYQYESRVSARGFLPDYQEPFYLTKHRVRLQPEAMKDVYFGPYDPSQALSSPDSTERMEAVTHLGLQKSPGAAGLLLDVLARAAPGRETYSVLWALGEVGGEAAETALLERIDDKDLHVRLEVVEALGRLGSRHALTHFVRGLELRGDGSYEASEYLKSQVQRACFDQLIVSGHLPCPPELLQLDQKYNGALRWRRCAQLEISHKLEAPRRGGEPGVLAHAALAAFGNESAWREIVDAIVVGGQVTEPEAIRKAAMQTGAINGFPLGFWMGIAVLNDAGHFSRQPWKSFAWVHDLLRVDSELRNRLYREAARDKRLANAGAIVLLANLTELREDDVAWLLDIWDQSIQEPWLTIDVEDHAQRMRSNRFRSDKRYEAISIPTIRFNYNACAVAYALGRHGRVAELRRLWKSVPPGDPVLRGEVIYAMTRTGNTSLRSDILSYVRDVWARNARSWEFEKDIDRWLASSTQESRYGTALDFAPFDEYRRGSAIRRYLRRHPPDGDLALELICDRTLPPYLRLDLFRLPLYRDERGDELLVIARRELDALMRASDSQDTAFVELAEFTRSVLERYGVGLLTGEE